MGIQVKTQEFGLMAKDLDAESFELWLAQKYDLGQSRASSAHL